MEACAALPDDLIVEILSRLPAKSVHRFKCVSKPWRDLITDRNHRKRLPQTLAGFFYKSWDNNRFPTKARHFTNVSGSRPPLVKPALAFLPNHADIIVLDCCNGLLLCCLHLPSVEEEGREAAGGRAGGTLDASSSSSPVRYNYFVCNPVTEKWVTLPDPWDFDGICTCRLAFDSAVSSHFQVFSYTADGDAQVYSSRTARWNHIALSWSGCVSLLEPASTVFFNGMLHFLTHQGVLIAVDLEAKEWKEIELPDVRAFGFLLRQSQDCLWFVGRDIDSEYQISFWTLEDGAWSLKHSVSTTQLFGGDFSPGYEAVAFHPDCNIFFFIMGEQNVLMSYDIDRGKAHHIVALGPGICQSFLPYVPWFSETLADEH